jgi:hypothetical protein
VSSPCWDQDSCFASPRRRSFDDVFGAKDLSVSVAPVGFPNSVAYTELRLAVNCFYVKIGTFLPLIASCVSSFAILVNFIYKILCVPTKTAPYASFYAFVKIFSKCDSISTIRPAGAQWATDQYC